MKYLYKNEKVKKKEYKRVEIREEEARCMWQRRRDNVMRDLRKLELKP